MKMKFWEKCGGPKSRSFAHHPQTEKRLGLRSLRMTVRLMDGILRRLEVAAVGAKQRNGFFIGTHPAIAILGVEHGSSAGAVFRIRICACVQ